MSYANSTCLPTGLEKGCGRRTSWLGTSRGWKWLEAGIFIALIVVSRYSLLAGNGRLDGFLGRFNLLVA